MQKRKDRVFAERLLEVMKERSVTQKRLAKEIERRPQTVSLYTKGEAWPNVLTLQKLADFLEVSSDWLIGRDGAVKYAHAYRVAANIGLTSGQLRLVQRLVRQNVELWEEICDAAPCKECKEQLDFSARLYEILTPASECSQEKEGKS